MIILENIIESYKLCSEEEWTKKAINEKSNTDTSIFKFFNENVDRANYSNDKQLIVKLNPTYDDWIDFFKGKLPEDFFFSVVEAMHYWILGKNYIAIPLLMTCVEGIFQNITPSLTFEKDGIEKSALPGIINSPYFVNIVKDDALRFTIRALLHKDGCNLLNKTILSIFSDEDFFKFDLFVFFILKIIFTNKKEESTLFLNKFN